MWSGYVLCVHTPSERSGNLLLYSSPGWSRLSWPIVSMKCIKSMVLNLVCNVALILTFLLTASELKILSGEELMSR